MRQDNLIYDAAQRLLGDYCDGESFTALERGDWPAQLWDAIAAAGLHTAAACEQRGGSGLDQQELMSLIWLGGKFGAPVPLAETILAEQMLAAASLAPLPGAATVGPVLRHECLALSRVGGHWVLDGILHRIPFGRHASALCAIATYEGQPTTVVIKDARIARKETNLAFEPRDTVVADRMALPDKAVGTPGVGLTVDELILRGALFRSIAMAGAIQRALELTVRYANDRVQFGRSLAKFQAIQQQIAVLACEAAASNAAMTGAVEASSHGASSVETAAAKVRVGEAAGIAANIAHQVHGAIGFTQEHELHRFTCRLWSWRDEFGSETEWATALCQAATPHGGEGLWPLLTAGGLQEG